MDIALNSGQDSGEVHQPEIIYANLNADQERKKIMI